MSSIPQSRLAAALTLALTVATAAAPTRAQEERTQGRITPVVLVARNASPAVVYIQTGGAKQGVNIFGQLVTQQFTGSGSGVVIHKEGFLITNYHVVKDARQITVSFDRDHDDATYPAQLVSYVEEEDLALLKIDGDKDFPTIPLGTSSDLMLGESVVAIGNPYGQTHTVSEGIISGLHRNVQIPGAQLTFDDLIQTDASINPGNSGGPLLNVFGELIGINSAMNVQAQNIGFAIPIDRVKQVLEEQLLAPQSASAWLGFEVDPGDQHMQVREVILGSPAHTAGLRAGDCIVGLAGQVVTSPEDYRMARIGLSPSREVSVRVESAGKSRELRLSPWGRVDGILYEHLGFRAQNREARGGSRVVISELRPEGPAAQLGLKPGDVLDAVRIQGGWKLQTLRVDSLEVFARLIQQVPVGTSIDIAILRDVDGDGRLTRNDEHRGTMVIE